MIDMDYNNEITPEKEFRKRIIAYAKHVKCEQDVINIFNRYDKLLLNCKNPVEKKAIALMGVTELHKLLDITGALVVDGQLILPGVNDPGYNKIIGNS